MANTTDIVTQVKELLDQETISLRVLESNTGYSRTALSQFFSGNYKGNVEAVRLSVERWFLRYDYRRKLVDTSTFNAIQMVLQLTWDNHELGVLYGEPGIGKTVSCEYFAEMNSDYAVYIRMDRILVPTSLLGTILERIGEPAAGNVDVRFERLLKALRMKNRMLIIDEADIINNKMLEILRSIYDDGNCAMALVGLDRIITLLTKGPALKENLAQLYSRVGFKRHLLKPKVEDMVKVAQSRDLELSAPAIKQLEEWTQHHGQLRMFTKILNNAEMLARAEGKAFNESYLKPAYNLLIGG